MYRIGIDVGGTFTDLVAVDAKGHVTLAKAPSTPSDQSLGVMEGLTRLAQALGLDRSQMLRSTERIVHGTTVATNALLERKGARVGLLTTEGHRDIIEMREGLKEERYNLRMPPPVQLMPRNRRLGVRERMRSDGRVEIPLDRDSLDAAIAILKRENVEAVAICYLHSWRDGRHERATAEAVRAAMPDVYVSMSSSVLPQIKEYDRTVRRGVDPRRFAILSFGGAAGLHVCDVASQLDIKRVIVPRLAAGLSAWGMLATDLRYELGRTHIGDASRLDPEALRRLYREMEADGRRQLAEASFTGPARAHRAADMRYGEQIFEVSVPIDGIDIAAPDLRERMAAAFHDRHEELYTYALRDQEAVLVNARVAVVGALPALPQEPDLPQRAAAAHHSKPPVKAALANTVDT